MNELTELLSELAVKLGTTTEYLWGILISQAPIEATVGILLIVLSFGLFVPYFKYAKWVSKNWNDIDENVEILHVTSIIIIGFTLFSLVLASCLDIKNIVTALINPEYWALSKILELL